MALKLDKKKAAAVAADLQSKWSIRKTDRKEVEVKAMENLRQYRSVYDPEIEQKLPEERSHAYPGDTRTKVKGFVAKMMEMMYPAEGKNWAVAPTPVPSIPEEDLQKIIQSLDAQVQAAAEQGQQIEVTSDMIENAVVNLARQRAEAMEKECADQMVEMPILDSELSKLALRSGGIYGAGYSKGPMATTKQVRTHVKNTLTGAWEAVVKDEPRPLYRPTSFWDLYPDLAAETWAEQDSIFERLIFSPHGLKQLSKTVGGVDESALKKYIKDNREGNYTEQDFEQEIALLNKTQNVANKGKRKFEVVSFRGFISGQDLLDMGVKVSKEAATDDVLVEIWLLDNTIIKLDQTPFGKVPADFYHAYIHGGDEDSGLLGIGLPADVRDTQLAICASTRMTHDNAAAVAGPIWEVNDDLLAKGGEVGSVHSFKVIHREGFGQDAQTQAVRQLNTESHIPELLNLTKSQRETLDIESSLPSWIFGATEPLGDAFRTTSNMSAMQGGATMVTKDNVRAFDNYVRSKIGSLIEWNKKFNKKPQIQGDFEAQPLGSRSLVTKELRGAALDQFWSTLTPQEKAMFDNYGVLKDRLEARDIPTSRLKPRSEAEAAVKQMEEAAAAAAQAEQGLTQAKTQDLSAGAQKKAVEAEAIAAKTPAEVSKAQAGTQRDLASAQATADDTRLKMVDTAVTKIMPQMQQGGQDVGNVQG